MSFKASNNLREIALSFFYDVGLYSGLKYKKVQFREVLLFVSHTSLKSKFAKLLSPEARTIYSESSWPGDSKNGLGKCVASNATFKKFHQKIGN